MVADITTNHNGTYRRIRRTANVVMGVKSLLDRLRSGGVSSGADDPGEPSHVCQTCGETYYLGPDVEIQTCRACGGHRLEKR
jgi:hypothetical protein